MGLGVKVAIVAVLINLTVASPLYGKVQSQRGMLRSFTKNMLSDYIFGSI